VIRGLKFSTPQETASGSMGVPTAKQRHRPLIWEQLRWKLRLLEDGSTNLQFGSKEVVKGEREREKKKGRGGEGENETAGTGAAHRQHTT
jgi:hypothetical protein